MSLKRKKIKQSALACLAVTLCATLTAGTALANFDARPKAGTSNNIKFTEVTDKFDTSALMSGNFNSSVLENSAKKTYETRTVIVYLNGGSVLDVKGGEYTAAQYLSTEDGLKTLRAIDREQKTFLNKLSSNGIKYKLKNSYSTIANAVAIEVDTSYVNKIKSFGGVESAVVAKTYLAPQTIEENSYNAVSNDANVYATGIYDSSDYSDKSLYSWGTGEGTVVAIIDTGLDYTHDAFQKYPDKYRMDKEFISDAVANTTAAARIAAAGGTLSADDVFVSNKVPFAFDYADDDADVYPSYSNHGTHVAGIVAGYDPNGYDNKDGEHINTPFTGVAPDAQLVICKTFTDDLDDPALGGAESENIMAALEDCVNLGVDVINMSLGTTAGFTSSDDGDDEGEKYNEIFESIREEGISLICAASNDYSAGFGSIYGTNLASNPDSGTVGSPSTYYAALSVASISGQKAPYMQASDGTAVFFENSRNGNGEEYDFLKSMLAENETSKEFEYVVAGSGQKNDYRGTVGELAKGRIALVKRGISTFQEKVEIAASMGAIGIIVYNNVSGLIRMSLGDVSETDLRPAVSISMDTGKHLVELAASDTVHGGLLGKITIDKNLSAGPFMSEFSSWGSTPDLKIKPEITAHGGEITSTVPGGYAEQSGTSMAAPNMAGLTALVRNYVKTLPVAENYTPSQITQLTNQLIMSTASTVYDDIGLAYSPRKQGSGLANLKNIVETKAYLFTDEDTAHYYKEKDGRPKVELGEDEKKTGVYSFDFKIANMSDTPLTYSLNALFMTETLDSEGVAVAERAYMLDDIAPVFTVNGSTVNSVTVGGNSNVKVSVKLTLSDTEKKYIDDSFKNGMYVEGFIKLENDGDLCDLNLPFLAFYGDWEAAPMLDYTAYEIADFEQDASILEEAKPSETVWATQAYASYSNDKYTIPLGSFVYNLGNEDPMYTSMEHCAISCFNEYVSDDGVGNYLTAYSIRCVYAGLLRNARRVNYKLYDAYTGELVYEGGKDRVSKAYANGGSATPAYVELKLTPQELGLVSNGKYRFDFEFLFDKDSEVKEENTFSFDFYVDYEAPVLQDARIRYYNYKENNRDKQRIYLDLDIYDNHYAQSVMLCYIDTESEVQALKLATTNVTPVRNAVKNGVTTVSIEVTDIWEEYKDTLAVQIDDYALNHRSYILAGFNSESDIDDALNKGVLPETFSLAEGEENITLGINQMHKVSLVYEGSADLSNFDWNSSTSRYVAVKNGEIVGLRSTGGKSYPVYVSNRKGEAKVINVTVTDNVVPVTGVSFGMNVIENDEESLVKANGSVTVRAGQDIQLNVVADPWYYPEKDIQSVVWSSANESVATVDENGLVHTKMRGAATITAAVRAGNFNYYCTVNLVIRDEFTISNNVLTRYYGEGEEVDGQSGVVVIPDGRQIMQIGDEAFKDNIRITKVIIPKTVTSIGENAFKGCTSLKGVYFMRDDDADYTADGFVADSDLTLINRNAFEGCTSLEIVDLRYVKIITLAREVFKDCVSLSTVVKSTAIGTMHHRAFLGCESLEKIDLSGVHVAGINVFSGCTALKEITTAKFTDIGTGMFSGLKYYYETYDYTVGGWVGHVTEYEACNALEEVTIKCGAVGVSAFEGCKNLSNLKFVDTDNSLEMRIGVNAFKDCNKLSSVNFGTCNVKNIGAGAFANTALTSIDIPQGLEIVGAGAFEGTHISALNGGDGYTVDDTCVISGTTILYYFGKSENFEIPAEITAIGANAFANSSIKHIVIPASVETIGEGAFMNSALESVTFECNLTEIPAYAFSGTNIESVELPSSVVNVGSYAFSDTPLTQFIFAPAASAVFGDGVFANCRSLVTINLDDKINEMGGRTFANCTSLQTVNLPSVKELGEYTFWNTPKLAEVAFGAESTVTGTYTFAAYSVTGLNVPATRASLKTVTLGNSLKKIGEGVFYNCTAISKINLNGATETGDFAFYNNRSLGTVNGIEKVVSFGAYSFTNCNALSTLNLAAAEEISEGAFSITEGTTYTSLSVPKVKTIGALAFYGGCEATIEIPASLTEIGGGAFAASSGLTAFTVADGNNIFFANNGVLYRNIENSDGFGLVAYPSAKAAEISDGLKTYSVIDNTLRIEAGAFRGLNRSIEKVILPYELKSIGSMAFYNSGITNYVFNGVSAPELEAEHSAYIDAYLDGLNFSFRGYYNANFNDYFINYTDNNTGVSPSVLTISRPDNGIGYDNYLYSNYFAATNLTGIAKDENTNEFIKLIDSFPAASEISGWKSPEKTKEEVQSFSDNVKKAREYYNIISRDEAQLAIAGEDRVNKLTEIETALRTVKPNFGINVSISRLVASGNYRQEYRVGEKFDMTGLEVIIEYDDFSTTPADMSRITLVTGALDELDNIVVLQGYGMTLRIRVTVTADGGSGNGGSGCATGCGSTTSAGDTMLLCITALGAMLLVSTVARKKIRGRK